MKFKAVGFDWGGVLNGRPGRLFGQEVAKIVGVSHADFLEAYFKHNKKVNRGEIDWPELWSLVLTELGHPELSEEITELSYQAHGENLNQDVLSLVDALRSQGYKVGLLSNNTVGRAKLMRQSGLEEHFDVFHISAETKLVKPEPEAFRHLADDLGVKLPELIFIDDSEKSLSTAQECGYTPILFENYSQLSQDLKRLGIQI